MSNPDTSCPVGIRETLPLTHPKGCPLMRFLPQDTIETIDINDDYYTNLGIDVVRKRNSLYCAGNGEQGCNLNIIGFDPKTGELTAMCKWNFTVVKLSGIKYVDRGYDAKKKYWDKFW